MTHVTKSHTPGPWSFETEGTARSGVSCEIIRNAEGIEVAFTQHHDFDGLEMAPDERYANARLIAAAPDLLALVKRAEFYINEQRKAGIGIGRTSGQFLIEAKEAIAKAEGK